jgi:hypothetical protein
VEVIKQNTRFQYEHSLAAQSVPIQIAYCRDNAGGNDLAIFSEMKKWRQKSGCAAIFGLTEVKNCCHKSRISAAADRAASLLEF